MTELENNIQAAPSERNLEIITSKSGEFVVVRVYGRHETNAAAWRQLDRLTGSPISPSEKRTEYFNKKHASVE